MVSELPSIVCDLSPFDLLWTHTYRFTEYITRIDFVYIFSLNICWRRKKLILAPSCYFIVCLPNVVSSSQDGGEPLRYWLFVFMRAFWHIFLKISFILILFDQRTCLISIWNWWPKISDRRLTNQLYQLRPDPLVRPIRIPVLLSDSKGLSLQNQVTVNP